MTRNLLWLSCAAGALMLGAGGARAATDTATAAAASESGGTVTELVVVAEHRETPLQKIPVAVSVFNGAERDLIGINTVNDVTNFAPGFSYDPTTVHAYIRGVGRQSINVTDDQRVSTYEDEFIVYSPYGLDKSSLFLAQEQIERGPQNVGGRAAAAGSIDMIRVRPTDHPYLEVRGSVAAFQSYNFELAASNELAPGLTGRIAGYYHDQNEGYFKNLVTHVSEGDANKEWYAEGQIDWKPNDRAELWLRASDEGWNNRGDAGARNFYNNGSWDETVLTDANFGSALFVNANYGYSAPNGNPLANAALVAAHGAGDKDPIPLSVSLFDPTILNSPAKFNPRNFAAWRARTVTLDKYADFNGIFTYKWDSFEFKYVGGIQGYNYSLFLPSQDSDVANFTLPGSSTPAAAFVVNALNHGFGGGAFPGCAACGLGGAAVGPATPLPAPSTLVINPQGISDYIENDVWTGHDFFFQSTNDNPFQWMAGAFFYYQHYDQPQEARYPNQPNLTQPFAALPSALLSPACGPLLLCGFSAGRLAAPNPRDDFAYFEYNFKTASEAGYAQVSYKFNDQFKFTGNLRYSEDQKWGDEKTRFVAFSSGIIDATSGFFGAGTPSLDATLGVACLTGNNTGANAAQIAASCAGGPLAKGVVSAGVIGADGFARRKLSGSSGAFTGGAGLEWTPTNDIFMYARYGRGYEAVSFSAGSVVANPEVAPEFLNSYEVGYKQNVGRGLSFDIAAFYYDYLNIQVPISFIGPSGLVQAAFVNVPKSVSDGVEFEGVWSPIKPLRLSLSYSYDHTAVLTKCFGALSLVGGKETLTPAAGAFCLLDTNDAAAVQPGANPFPGQTTAGKVQGVNGDPLPNAPANKVAFSGAYTFQFDPGSLTLEGSYAWRDSQDGNLFRRSYTMAPAWDDVDLRATWKGKGDRYEVIGYVRNIFNTLQYPVGNVGAQYAGTDHSIGLTETDSFQLAPPRTYGFEVRYKFF